MIVTCRRFSTVAFALLVLLSCAVAQAEYEVELAKIRQSVDKGDDITFSADFLEEELSEMLSQVDDDIAVALDATVTEKLVKLRAEFSQSRTSKYRSAHTALQLIQLAATVHTLPSQPMEETPQLRAEAAERYGKLLTDFQTEVAKRSLSSRSDFYLKTQIPKLLDEARQSPLAPGYGIRLDDDEMAELSRLLQATIPAEQPEPMGELSPDEKAKRDAEMFRAISVAYQKVWLFIIQLDRSRRAANVQIDPQNALWGKTVRILGEKLGSASRHEMEARSEYHRREAERKKRESFPQENSPK